MIFIITVLNSIRLSGSSSLDTGGGSLADVDDYSNECARARSLGTAAKIKIIEESSLLFTGLWFGTCVLFMRLSSEKYKIAPWKKNDYEDLDDLLVSFKLHFIITEDSSCIFTMYYLLSYIYMVLMIKKNHYSEK
jgi:hypothetical protein